MKKKFCISVIMMGFSLLSNAQNDPLQTAFAKSYEKESKKEFSGAIEPLKSMYDPKSYEINLRLGWLNYEAGLLTESASYYEKATALMPYSIEAKLGLIYPSAALANWDVVVGQYKKVLEIDPQNSTANYQLGFIEYNKKNFAACAKYFEKVVNLYPFGYDGLLMLAWTNYRLGKTREAKILFGKVLLLSPKDASATEGLSLIK